MNTMYGYKLGVCKLQSRKEMRQKVQIMGQKTYVKLHLLVTIVKLVVVPLSEFTRPTSCAPRRPILTNHRLRNVSAHHQMPINYHPRKRHARSVLPK